MTITRRRALRTGAVALGGSFVLASTGTRTGMAASVEPVENQIAIKADDALSELQVSSLDLSLDWKGIDDASEPVAFELGVRVDGGARQRLAEGSISLGGQSYGNGLITNSGDAPTWDVAPWDEGTESTIGLLSGASSVSETFGAGGTYDLEFDVQFEHAAEDVTASDTTTITLDVLRALDADASVSPEVGAFDEVYTFDASGTVGPDGHDLTYEWDFGDGTTATGVTATHSFDSVGTHTVSLTVYDEDGDSDTAECEVTIENPAPNAVASADVQTVYAGNEIAFDATASSDPLGESLTYEWDFTGDGTVDATGASQTHTYESVGEYVATLTVTDEGGNTATDTVSITVESLPDSATFQYVGEPEVYDVSGLSTVKIELRGAGGQGGETHALGGEGGSGGVGGYIEGMFDVSEFSELYVYVGGGNGTRWGYNNGGSGGNGGDFRFSSGPDGGNGGGSTEIYGDDSAFIAAADAGGGGGGACSIHPDISYDEMGGGGGGGGGSGGNGGDGGSGVEADGNSGDGAEGNGTGGNGGDAGDDHAQDGHSGGNGGQSYNETYARTIEQETRGGGNNGHGEVVVEPVA